jgi:hypothetical protein
MSSTSTTPRRYRLALLLAAIGFFVIATFVSTIIVRKPPNALSPTGAQSALARAERFCSSNGHGYRITNSEPVYNSTAPPEPIYVDANCTSAGRRTVRILADVHSGYVWNDRDGALYYVK